jgi:KDO2-lipid IV(A) lauroyltransferase
MYIISDIFRFLIYNFIPYRKKVVISNLKKSFPEKSDKEIQYLTKKFYLNFCDITLETIKGFSMSKKQTLQRFKVLNPELADKYFEEGKDNIILAGHYCNWEWGILACDMQFKHTVAALYKKMSNPYAESYSKKKRSRFGGDLVTLEDSKEYFVAQKEKPVGYIMAADQNPSNPQKAVWVNFLNQETGFLAGPEKYAATLNIPVIYYDVQRVKRGYYTLEVIDISEKPQKLERGILTKIYADTLDKIIRKKPENWLWSHKRWKYEKPDSCSIVS